MPNTSLPLHFQDHVVVLGGRTDKWRKKSLTSLVKSEGGRVADSFGDDTTVVIICKKGSVPEKSAKAAIKKGRDIRILDDKGLADLLLPSPDEAAAVLRNNKGGQRLHDRLERAGGLLRSLSNTSNLTPSPVLRGENLSKCDLRRLPVNTINQLEFVDCDLSGIKTKGQNFCSPQGCSFEDASCNDTDLHDVSGCNLDGITLKKGHIYTPYRQKFLPNTMRNAQLDNAGVHYSQKLDMRGSVAKRFGIYFGAVECNFSKSKLHFEGLHGEFKDCDFSDSVIEGMFGYESHYGRDGAEFRKCSFKKTDFRKAHVEGSTFIDCDFTNADFSGAQVSYCTFKNCKLKGAKFDSAKLFGNTVNATAKGKDTMLPGEVRASGKSLDAFDKVTGDRIDIDLAISTGKNKIVASVLRFKKGRPKLSGMTVEAQPNTLGDVLRLIVRKHAKAKLDVDASKFRTRKCKLNGKQLEHLVTKAWQEAIGGSAPSDAELDQRDKAKAKAKKQQKAAAGVVRTELLTQLRSGDIAAFNKRTRKAVTEAGPFKGSDLAGTDLSGVNLSKLDLRDSDFTDAILHDANFAGAMLDGANFHGADLRAAKFLSASLKGCNFTNATIKNAKWSKAVLDHKTTWPKGSLPPRSINWQGDGPSPAALAALEKKTAAARKTRSQNNAAIDTAEFMKRLRSHVDYSRREKALKMLKASRFELFSTVTDEGVIGVVKSQTNKELIYAARLDSDGGFSCCTHKLNACGGLRGAPCKHILVLIMGLTQGGAVDPEDADLWMGKSSLQKPLLDKEAMADLLLRYKGAEAGEIDWRPTETIPEDYYAF